MKYTARQILLAQKNGQTESLRKQMIVEEIRKRYSVSDELAVLRQKESKPEEFAAYYTYAESCKTLVSDHISSALSEEGER